MRYRFNLCQTEYAITSSVLLEDEVATLRNEPQAGADGGCWEKKTELGLHNSTIPPTAKVKLNGGSRRCMEIRRMMPSVVDLPATMPLFSVGILQHPSSLVHPTNAPSPCMT